MPELNGGKLNYLDLLTPDDFRASDEEYQDYEQTGDNFDLTYASYMEKVHEYWKPRMFRYAETLQRSPRLPLDHIMEIIIDIVDYAECAWRGADAIKRRKLEADFLPVWKMIRERFEIRSRTREERLSDAPKWERVEDGLQN
jgi:hypothetical protein